MYRLVWESNSTVKLEFFRLSIREDAPEAERIIHLAAAEADVNPLKTLYASCRMGAALHSILNLASRSIAQPKQATTRDSSKHAAGLPGV